jgi:hypothetical protein
MVSNEDRDQRARRALAEARALIDRKIEPYVPPRRALLGIYYGAPIAEPIEPEAEPTAFERQPQADPWAGWNQWLETKLNAALAIERQELIEIVAQVIADEREALAHVVADERERAAEAWRAQVDGLRADLTRCEAVLEQLRKLVEFERARTIDLPALPARRDMN